MKRQEQGHRFLAEATSALQTVQSAVVPSLLRSEALEQPADAPTDSAANCGKTARFLSMTRALGNSVEAGSWLKIAPGQK